MWWSFSWGVWRSTHLLCAWTRRGMMVVSLPVVIYNSNYWIRFCDLCGDISPSLWLQADSICLALMFSCRGILKFWISQKTNLIVLYYKLRKSQLAFSCKKIFFEDFVHLSKVFVFLSIFCNLNSLRYYSNTTVLFL